MEGTWRARVLAPVLALAVALLVTGPALAPGFVLLRDMVFVPRQALGPDAFGLGGSLPRAVPADALLGLLTTVVPGDVLQKILLVGTIWLAVLGAARLVPPGPDGRRGPAAGVAGLVYGWSPYVAERLLMGHWTLLLGFAALPWIARAGLLVRAGERGALPRLVLACAPAALSPSGALLAAGVALATVGRKRVLQVLGVLTVLALPWVLAGALHPSGGISDPAGVPAFAARAENWGGALLAVLGTGGLWNADAVPASRASVLTPLATLAIMGLAAYGWLAGGLHRGPLRRLLDPRPGRASSLPSPARCPGWRTCSSSRCVTIPGAGLLRDGQKWAAWWALPLALGAGLGARHLSERLRGRVGVAVGAAFGVGVAAGALLLPVAALPDLAWGVGGSAEDRRLPGRLAEACAMRSPRTRVPATCWSCLSAPTGPSPGTIRPSARSTRRPAGWPGRRSPTTRSWSAAGSWRGRTCAPGRPAGRPPGPGAAGRSGHRLGAGGGRHARVGPCPAGVHSLPARRDRFRARPCTGCLVRVAGPAPAPERVTAVVLAHACALGTVVGAALWISWRASTVTLRRRPLRKRVNE